MNALNGRSTKMPSVNVSLPLHVIARGPRRDGTYNVLYRVRRDLPSGWPSSIPIPFTGRRTGNLNDADEVARIINDAETLAARLEAARVAASPATHTRGTIPEIIERWKQRWEDEELRPRSRDFYIKCLRPIEAWSAENGHPHVSTLTLPDMFRFLRMYDDRPSMRSALRRVLSAMLSFALIEGDIKAHPFNVAPRLAKRRSPKRKVEPWTPADVDGYASAALALGWPAGARMVRLMWETSADATDVVTWRRDRHFRDGVAPAIVYSRGKTGVETTIPISQSLAADIRASGDLFFVVDPSGQPYRADDVSSDSARGNHYRRLRATACERGGRHLMLDHLRHSAVTHALECGAKLEHLPSLTAHRGTQMVEHVYSQMTEAQARAVQQARGIV